MEILILFGLDQIEKTAIPAIPNLFGNQTGWLMAGFCPCNKPAAPSSEFTVIYAIGFFRDRCGTFSEFRGIFALRLPAALEKFPTVEFHAASPT